MDVTVNRDTRLVIATGLKYYSFISLNIAVFCTVRFANFFSRTVHHHIVLLLCQSKNKSGSYKCGRALNWNVLPHHTPIDTDIPPKLDVHSTLHTSLTFPHVDVAHSDHLYPLHHVKLRSKKQWYISANSSPLLFVVRVSCCSYRISINIHPTVPPISVADSLCLLHLLTLPLASAATVDC